MNANTQAITLQGPVGPIEALIDKPADQLAGGDASSAPVVVIAHPHPLFAGTMHNKVVQTLARAFVQSGWRAVRFNFRGVGQSAGSYDEGRGEAEDMLRVIEQVASADQTSGRLALAGFSFGSFVTAGVAAQLRAQGREVEQLVLVGTATERFAVEPIAPEWHERTLVVHGEVDDVVSLASVYDWARPQSLPITVLPGVGHFFHGQLHRLKRLVMRHLHSAPLG